MKAYIKDIANGILLSLCGLCFFAYGEDTLSAKTNVTQPAVSDCEQLMTRESQIHLLDRGVDIALRTPGTIPSQLVGLLERAIKFATPGNENYGSEAVLKLLEGVGFGNSSDPKYMALVLAVHNQMLENLPLDLPFLHRREKPPWYSPAAVIGSVSSVGQQVIAEDSDWIYYLDAETTRALRMAINQNLTLPTALDEDDQFQFVPYGPNSKNTRMDDVLELSVELIQSAWSGAYSLRAGVSRSNFWSAVLDLDEAFLRFKEGHTESEALDEAVKGVLRSRGVAMSYRSRKNTDILTWSGEALANLGIPFLSQGAGSATHWLKTAETVWDKRMDPFAIRQLKTEEQVRGRNVVPIPGTKTVIVSDFDPHGLKVKARHMIRGALKTEDPMGFIYGRENEPKFSEKMLQIYPELNLTEGGNSLGSILDSFGHLDHQQHLILKRIMMILMFLRGDQAGFEVIGREYPHTGRDLNLREYMQIHQMMDKLVAQLKKDLSPSDIVMDQVDVLDSLISFIVLDCVGHSVNSFPFGTVFGSPKMQIINEIFGLESQIGDFSFDRRTQRYLEVFPYLAPSLLRQRERVQSSIGLGLDRIDRFNLGSALQGEAGPEMWEELEKVPATSRLYLILRGLAKMSVVKKDYEMQARSFGGFYTLFSSQNWDLWRTELSQVIPDPTEANDEDGNNQMDQIPEGEMKTLSHRVALILDEDPKTAGKAIHGFLQGYNKFAVEQALEYLVRRKIWFWKLPEVMRVGIALELEYDVLENKVDLLMFLFMTIRHQLEYDRAFNLALERQNGNPIAINVRPMLEHFMSSGYRSLHTYLEKVSLYSQITESGAITTISIDNVETRK